MRPIIKILAFFIVLIFLLPAVELGSFNFKPDLLLACLLGVIMLVAVKSPVNRLKQVKLLWIVTAAIFVIMISSDNLGYYYLKKDFALYFPREFIQIFARVSVFVGFLYIGFYQIIKKKHFVSFVSLVFLIGLIFGLFQKLGFPLIQSISVDYFALSDQQIYSISSKNTRVFGTAGNVLTWGGVSMLLSFYFLFVEKRKLYRNVGVAMALINVFISGSRASIIGTIAGFIFIQFYRSIVVEKKFSRGTIRLLGLLLLGIGIFVFAINYFPTEINFMATRFLSTSEDITNQGRGAQFQYFLEYFNGQEAMFVFGLGKPVMDGGQRMMEIEFAYLGFAYGIVGFVLHYYLIWILVSFSSSLKSADSDMNLFILSASIAFLVFSVGYYFFREIIGGLPYWWLSGYLIGEALRKREINQQAQRRINSQV